MEIFTKADLIKFLEPFTDECKILISSQDTDIFTTLKIEYKQVSQYLSSDELYIENFKYKEHSNNIKNSDFEGAIIISF